MFERRHVAVREAVVALDRERGRAHPACCRRERNGAVRIRGLGSVGIGGAIGHL